MKVAFDLGVCPIKLKVWFKGKLTLMFEARSRIAEISPRQGIFIDCYNLIHERSKCPNMIVPMELRHTKISITPSVQSFILRGVHCTLRRYGWVSMFVKWYTIRVKRNVCIECLKAEGSLFSCFLDLDLESRHNPSITKNLWIPFVWRRHVFSAAT